MAYKKVVVILLAAAIGTTVAEQKQTLDNQEEPAPEPYSFSYSAESTGGFSSRQESGDGTGRVSGFYTILGDDGRSRRVDYVADENGYRASISTNEVGTRTGRTGDASYEVQAPSAGQLEAARVSAEEYALLERPHLQAQGIRESTVVSDFRQDDGWRSRAALLAPPTNDKLRQANFQYQPANINSINRQSASDIGQQQQQWRQPRSESIAKSQFSRSLGTLNGPEQINNSDPPQQLTTVISQPIQQQAIRPRQAIQPSILQTQMERQFMLQATQLTQQDYPRRELEAGAQEQQQPWRQFERERQQVVELSSPANQQQQSNIINEVVDQQNEGELIPSTELPLIPQPVKGSTNSEQSSSSTSMQDESLKFTERPSQSTSVTTSSVANTSVEQPSSVSTSSTIGSSNQASSVGIQQQDQVQQITSSSQASNFLPELTTRLPMIWRPITSIQTQQQQAIKQAEGGAKQSGGLLTGVVMRVTSTSTSYPTTEEPEVAVVTTSTPGFRVTPAPEPETTVQTAAVPVKQQEVAVSSVSSTSANKWTQFNQQQQIERKPIWQQGIKGSKVVAQQSWIKTPFRKPQINLQQQQKPQQQVPLGVEYLNSTPSPTTSSISEDQPSIQQNFEQQQLVSGGQTKWTDGGTKGGSKSSGNRFWKSRPKGRLSEAFNNQGSFGSAFGSRLNLGTSTL